MSMLMWINGEAVNSVTKREFPVENPATEEIIDTVPRANAEDIDLAVKAAVNAQEDWRFVPGGEKAELLHEVARKIREKKHDIAVILTKEGGKPYLENRDEVEWIASVFDYYAEMGRDYRGRVIAPVQRHQLNFVIKEPYGVVSCIAPWNYPLLLMCWKVAPALAAGNTVIMKPAQHTPMSTLALAECFDHLPKGVVNIVCGYGSEIGDILITHKGIDMVAFTGSTSIGQRIGRLAAEGIKKISLELGGNDPFIVCDDVDVDIAVKGAVWASFLNMGQVCTSAERFYVFEKIADEFIDKFVKHTKELRIGDPMGPDVDLGPMVNAEQRQEIEEKLERAVKQGAKILTGGKRPEHLKKGYYLEPAVAVDVTQEMELMQEETFGPIAPIMAVKNIEEAIKFANQSKYGLAANIYTNNLEYAMYAMERIKAGSFWINDPLTDNDACPFGGMKMSGLGRELGTEGLEEFRETKHLHLDYKIEAKPYWFPYDWSKGRKTE